MITVIFLNAKHEVCHWDGIEMVTFDPLGRPVFHKSSREDAERYTSVTSRLADDCTLLSIIAPGA